MSELDKLCNLENWSYYDGWNFIELDIDPQKAAAELAALRKRLEDAEARIAELAIANKEIRDENAELIDTNAKLLGLFEADFLTAVVNQATEDRARKIVAQNAALLAKEARKE